MEFAFGPNQLAWLTDLESGKYAQAREMLSCADGLCCLGVAAKHVLKVAVEVFNPAEVNWEILRNWDYSRGYIELLDGEETMLSPDAAEKMGLRCRSGGFSEEYRENHQERFSSLADMNDRGKTFAEIAAFMRENPRAVFKHPA